MSKVDWSLAPECATHYRSDTKNVFWYKKRGEDFMYFEESSGQWNYSSASDRVVRSFIERPVQPKQWSGPQDGLPPVGTVCEWKEKTGFQWVKATVLFVSDSSVVLQRMDGFEWQMMTARTVFRQFKTAGQLAAEQRETAIREIMDIADVDCRVTAARLVDAGFKREVV